jgi:hypothetical protein
MRRPALEAPVQRSSTSYKSSSTQPIDTPRSGRGSKNLRHGFKIGRHPPSPMLAQQFCVSDDGRALIPLGNRPTAGPRPKRHSQSSSNTAGICKTADMHRITNPTAQAKNQAALTEPSPRLTSVRPWVRKQWPGDCRCQEPHQCAQDQKPDRPGEESELVRREQLQPDDGAQPFQIAGSQEHAPRSDPQHVAARPVGPVQA